MDRDELDNNLHELRAELDDLVAPTKYDQIMEPNNGLHEGRAEP